MAPTKARDAGSETDEGKHAADSTPAMNAEPSDAETKETTSKEDPTLPAGVKNVQVRREHDGALVGTLVKETPGRDEANKAANDAYFNGRKKCEACGALDGIRKGSNHCDSCGATWATSQNG